MNYWEHPSIIAAEALRHLEDRLVLTNMCARDLTSEFTQTSQGWKRGDTVSFRTHGDYETKDFSSTIDVQDISTSTRSMQIEKHFDISVNVTAREMALDFDSFSDQVLKPAAYRMAESCELYVAGKVTDGAGLYTSADLYATAADVALARKLATEQQLGMQRFSIVDLEYEAKLLGQTWFNQSQTRGLPGVATLQSGIMGHVMGMDWYPAITFPTTTRTAGDGTSTTDNTAGTFNAIGTSTLQIDALTDQIEAGDRVAVAGCRRPLIASAQFVATSTAITLVDPITEVIADGAAVSVVGSGATYTVHGAIFDERSLAVAFPMLDAPNDRVTAVASNNGVNLRVVTGYELNNKTTTMSIDCLCGAFAFDPRRITLVADNA